MRDFLILLRKSDFTDLFRLGYIHIDRTRAVEFDGNVTELSADGSIKSQLFSNVDPFEYSFVFLIVHFRNDYNSNGRLNIEDVQSIFALDKEAKRTIELSYDPRIVINEPIWPEIYSELQERFLLEDSKKGVFNIWSILNLSTPVAEVSSIISESDLAEMVHEICNGLRPSGNLSFWIYLMRYERHGYFPKSTLGYFYDLVNVFINKVYTSELPAEAIESTEIFKILESLNNANSMVQIIDQLADIQGGRNFLDKVNELNNMESNACVIAILFLIFKDKFSEDFKYDDEIKNIIKYAFLNYPKETPFALFLIGLFLGNSHTFECMYDQMPLPIFKKKTVAPDNGDEEDTIYILTDSEDGFKIPNQNQSNPVQIVQDTISSLNDTNAVPNLFDNKILVPESEVRTGHSHNVDIKSELLSDASDFLSEPNEIYSSEHQKEYNHTLTIGENVEIRTQSHPNETEDLKPLSIPKWVFNRKGIKELKSKKKVKDKKHLEELLSQGYEL